MFLIVQRPLPSASLSVTPTFRPCMPDEHRCGDGTCVPKSYVCDNRPDCRDMSDEINCGEWLQTGWQIVTCVEFYLDNVWHHHLFLLFTFANRKSVVDIRPLLPVFTTSPTTTTTTTTTTTAIKKPPRPPSPPGPCRADQATCQSGECIPRDYICDGERDCSDGSDEFRCGKHHSQSTWTLLGNIDAQRVFLPVAGTPSPCEPNEFKCKNGRCALKLWRCDGDNDCEDNSDETDCRKSACCRGLC